ncbi:MAG: EcsC family protein [Gammaproteobacteria bacterium]|nr:EcsC family protein [Gammaproteobacteria bacterium]NNL49739.1 EcsC family protein [Woeseiaceae bacterium]
MGLTTSEVAMLEDAYAKLENPSLAIRISSAVGMPVEAVTRELGKRAPDVVVEAVSKSTHKALEMVLQSSMRSIKGQEQTSASPRLHTAAAMTTGAVAGFFGLETLIVELPLTTGIMFRSIADIARAEGESPADPETFLNCMQVFAMGSRESKADDAAETSYYGVRVALSKAVTDALQYVAAHGMGGATAPALVRLVSALASRFGIVVTQKAMAQTIPVIGAIGGGLVNTVFISHFQDMARGHFAIRALERKYGVTVVRDAYQRLKADRQRRELTIR